MGMGSKKELTVKENLAKARAKSHKTQKKNGHFKRMLEIRWSNHKKKKDDD
jgi:hypothetical protein